VQNGIDPRAGGLTAIEIGHIQDHRLVAGAAYRVERDVCPIGEPQRISIGYMVPEGAAYAPGRAGHQDLPVWSPLIYHDRPSFWSLCVCMAVGTPSTPIRKPCAPRWPRHMTGQRGCP